MRDRPGHLFTKHGPTQRVAHEAVVDVGGKQWQACVESDCLRLTTTIRTDNEKDQTASRIANIKREVEARQQELEDLRADLARVIEEAEAVGLIPPCLFVFAISSNLYLFLCSER